MTGEDVLAAARVALVLHIAGGAAIARTFLGRVRRTTGHAAFVLFRQPDTRQIASFVFTLLYPFAVIAGSYAPAAWLFRPLAMPSVAWLAAGVALLLASLVLYAAAWRTSASRSASASTASIRSANR